MKKRLLVLATFLFLVGAIAVVWIARAESPENVPLEPRVVETQPADQSQSTVASAKTDKSPDPIHLVAVGDFGTGDEEALLTADAIAKEHSNDPYDALLLLGDNVYEDGDPARLPETVFGPFEPLLSTGVDMWPVLGNHDVDDGFGDAQRDALSMPGNWYSVTMGDTLLVALDSTLPGHPDQQEWLTETLDGNDARWTIVIMHHPLYSAGYHGSSNSNREAFLPIIEQYGADLVLAGHDHDYQRSKPQDGTTYIVTGGSARLRDTGTAYFTEVSSSQYHFVDLMIFEDRIEIQAIGRDGVFDSVVLS